MTKLRIAGLVLVTLIVVIGFRSPVASFIGSIIGLVIGFLISESREQWVCRTCGIEYDSSKRFVVGPHKACPNGCPSDRCN